MHHRRGRHHGVRQGAGRNPRTRPRWFTRRHNRRHEAAHHTGLCGVGQRHRRACARLRRHVQSGPDHHPRQCTAVAGHRRGQCAGRCLRQGCRRRLRRGVRSADPGRGRGGARPLRRRLARDRHGGTHRGGSRNGECARFVRRPDPGCAGIRRDPVGGHEGRLRLDGQVPARGQGRDGRARLGFPCARGVHVKQGTH